MHQQCPEEYADVGVEVESSGNLLLVCTEALCTSRVGGSRSSTVLVPRNLEEAFEELHTEDSEHPDWWE